MASPVHALSFMSRHRRIARTYDEIVRSTVIDPEGSRRPTARQERVAREGYRELDPHERALRDRVIEALEDALRSSNDTWSFQVDIDRDTVKMWGHVHDAAVLALVEKTVKRIEGVVDLDNAVVVGT